MKAKLCSALCSCGNCFCNYNAFFQFHVLHVHIWNISSTALNVQPVAHMHFINTHSFPKIAACLRPNSWQRELSIMTYSMWPCGNLPLASLCACWLLQCWGKMTPLYTLHVARKTVKDSWNLSAEYLMHSLAPTISYRCEFQHRVKGAPQVWQLICKQSSRNQDN